MTDTKHINWEEKTCLSLLIKGVIMQKIWKINNKTPEKKGGSLYQG